jgi:hypothetical protein
VATTIRSTGSSSRSARANWGYTLEDFTDQDLSLEDLSWLDGLTRDEACEFAAGIATTAPITATRPCGGPVGSA